MKRIEKVDWANNEKDKCFINGNEYVKTGKLTSIEQIKKHPEQFERMAGDRWEKVELHGDIEIVNSDWNFTSMDGNVFFVKFMYNNKNFFEIIRRKHFI